MDNSDKIKIEINGYTVFANSVEEARVIIGAIPAHQVPTKVTKKDERIIQTGKKLDGRRFNGFNFHKEKKEKVVEEKTRKSTPGSRWTSEEVQFILENAHLGSQAIMVSKNLLARHSKMGIQQMYWKASRNPRSYVVRRDIQAVIDAYYAKYPERLLVKGGKK